MKEKRKINNKTIKQTKTKKARRNGSNGFLQLICKASLTFKSNLELTLQLF